MVLCVCLLKALLVVLVLLGILKVWVKATTGWCRSQTCLLGKTALVTGANTGIGYETAIDFAKRGARVILACRSREKAQTAKDQIIRETGNDNVAIKLVDMSSLASVRAFAKDILQSEKRLDILVNNAGAGGLGRAITEDGLQLGMQVNFLAPFLLTILLLGLLKTTGNSRIVNVASIAGKYARLDINALNGFPGDLFMYARSKLCNILFTRELAIRLSGTTVTTYSLHPGLVSSDFPRNMVAPKRILVQFIFQTIYKGEFVDCSGSPQGEYSRLFPCFYTATKKDLLRMSMNYEGFSTIANSWPVHNYNARILSVTPIEGAQTSIYTSVQRGIEQHNGEHFHDCHLVKPYKTALDKYKAKRLWEIAEDLVKLTPEERKNI